METITTTLDNLIEHQTYIALHVSGPMSRGSAIGASQSVTSTCLQLRGGVLVGQGCGNTIVLDFHDGEGDVDCFPATLPDLIPLWRSTGIANIKCFLYVSGTAFPSGDLDELPGEPSP